MRKYGYQTICLAIVLFSAFTSGYVSAQDDDSTRNVLKQGLLGAGTGAIASSVSGGNAGTGALVGAGTNVIGGALLDAMTTPSSSSRTYRRPAPPPDDGYYYDDQSGEEYYVVEEQPQESSSSKVLKQGLLGAGTGAIASSVSGGNAGTGALVGAGTNVIGGALLDTITQPSAPQRRVYRRPAPRPAVQAQPKTMTSTSEEAVGTEGSRKKIIRKYDENGKVVSEEEIYY